LHERQWDDSIKQWIAECKACLVSVSNATEAGVIAAWNTRPEPITYEESFSRINRIFRDGYSWDTAAVIRTLVAFAEGKLSAGDRNLGLHTIAAQGARDWLRIYDRDRFQ
jgi:hypothetical protein